MNSNVSPPSIKACCCQYEDEPQNPKRWHLAFAAAKAYLLFAGEPNCLGTFSKRYEAIRNVSIMSKLKANIVKHGYELHGSKVQKQVKNLCTLDDKDE
mmetsp:Transcript_21453/g.31505  ORF Transcript_21453/g.31505 Transcript_21453/m.31505 type:complete len:98 (+) Transcript_21453:401-694(+)